MPKNKRHPLRVAITCGLIVLAALVGLMATRVKTTTAQEWVAQTADTTSATATSSSLPLTGSQATDYGSAMGAMIRMLSALIIVILAIYLGVFALRRMLNRRALGRGSVRALEVIQSTPVGPKKSVTLIRVADKSVLVGITDSRISILTELTEEETGKLLAAEDAADVHEPFSATLSQALGRLKGLRVKGGPAAMET